MKIRLLIILFVLVLIPVQLIYAPPSPNEWPDAPYCPGGCTLDYLKEKWALYYDYKGAEWMNQKKIELLDAIKTDTLTEWMKLTPNGANSNVHDYYFYMGEIPNHNDIYVKQYFEGYIPPLKQFKSGIPIDEIKCKNELVLVTKSVNNSPACVKSTSIGKLVRNGWFIWNKDVGLKTKIDEKKPFDGDVCSLGVPKISLVGSNGFVKSTLPDTGIVSDYERIAFGEFVLNPNSTGKILMIIDFNSDPSNLCKITTQDVMTFRYNDSISNFFGTVDFHKINPITNNLEFLNSGDMGIQVKLSNIVNMTNDAILLEYVIRAEDSSDKNSYLVKLPYNCVGTVFTVGDSFHQGSFPWDKDGEIYRCLSFVHR